jgi:hypothetical protein
MQFSRQHDWSAVCVEISVVVIGLMLAFQLDRWWEARGERVQESEYLARLIDDIESDISTIGDAIELARLRKEMVDLLIDVVENPAAATERPVLFVAAVQQSAFTYSPNLASHTFEEMRSTGNLRLLRDPDIKKALYGYYDFDRSQNQYRPLQFMTEARHFELAAGVLSYEHSRLVQDTWYVVAPGNLDDFDETKLDVAEIQDAVKRFRSREDLVAWLPELRHLQIEQIFVNENRLQKAHTVIDLLKRDTVILD